MPSRNAHDPFTDSALRPTTLNPSVRAQTSSQSLRSNASTASARTRHPGTELFAPSLSRRPTSRTTPRVEDDVLADPDSDDQAPPLQPRLRHATRRTRHASPEKLSRSRARHEDEVEMVNRQADGSFLLDGNLLNDCYAQHMADPQLVETRNDEENDAYYAAISRQYFTSGMAQSSSSARRSGGDPSELATEVMAHLRKQATKALKEESWRFEPTDRYQAHYP